MKYTIILEKEEEGGYSAQCLELPGAISQGETKEETLMNIEEAIEAVLEVLNQEIKWLGAAAEISTVGSRAPKKTACSFLRRNCQNTCEIGVRS
ncbi:type II toxin-antitoxin system HicB family antitoxin [Methanosarcinales archaeon]|nr:MAG: type II toxin-antitoxin system HicB family antitoxin [Methanosarcinales archaeon]